MRASNTNLAPLRRRLIPAPSGKTATLIKLPVAPIAGEATLQVQQQQKAIAVRGAFPYRRLCLGLLSPILLLFFWDIASRAGLVPQLILPSPETVYSALASMVASGDLAANLTISVRRVASGFAAGALIGLVLGAAMGLSPRVERFLRPTFLAVAQIPVLAWIPFLMILFGIGEALKIVIIAEAALIPTMLNTLDGFRNIPKAYLELGRIYKFGKLQTLRRIMLPGALLPIFTGLRYGLTHAWQSLVVVELLASTEGVGYQMVMARQLFQLDVMIATMIVIGIIGFTLDKLLAQAETTLARRYGGAT